MNDDENDIDDGLKTVFWFGFLCGVVTGVVCTITARLSLEWR